MSKRILLTEAQLTKALQTIVEEHDELLTRTVEEYEKESEKAKITSSSSSHEKDPYSSE